MLLISWIELTAPYPSPIIYSWLMDPGFFFGHLLLIFCLFARHCWLPCPVSSVCRGRILSYFSFLCVSWWFIEYVLVFDGSALCLYGHDLFYVFTNLYISINIDFFFLLPFEYFVGAIKRFLLLTHCVIEPFTCRHIRSVRLVSLAFFFIFLHCFLLVYF